MGFWNKFKKKEKEEDRKIVDSLNKLILDVNTKIYRHYDVLIINGDTSVLISGDTFTILNGENIAVKTDLSLKHKKEIFNRIQDVENICIKLAKYNIEAVNNKIIMNNLNII